MQIHNTTLGHPCPQVLHPRIQPTTDASNLGSKIFEKNYIVANVYYAVRPMMVASVLNMYRLFSYHYTLNNLYSIYIVLGIISNREMI